MKSYRNTKEDIENIPKNSGIYFFYDGNDKLLYVGKAKLLRTRIDQHKYLNDRLREKRYYRIMGISRTKDERAILEKNFNKAQEKWREGETALVIDNIFHRVKRIEIEEMPHEFTKEKEKELIQKLKPPFNFETACDEYYAISGIGNLDLDEIPKDVQYM